MAKFVGKIFKVSNNKIGIRNDGAHNVHVVWYNPFKRKFRCKVITSLESAAQKTRSDCLNVTNMRKSVRVKLCLFPKVNCKALLYGQVIRIRLNYR